MFVMNGTVEQSWTDAGAVLLGLFVFYVVMFGIAWCWGYRQR